MKREVAQGWGTPMGVILVKSVVLVTFSVFSLTESTAAVFVVPFTVFSR